jgi:hypothetical protein
MFNALSSVLVLVCEIIFTDCLGIEFHKFKLYTSMWNSSNQPRRCIVWTLPVSERQRFENLLMGQAQKYGLEPSEYLKKVWYHEQASKLGEYIAMTLLEELLPLVPAVKPNEEEMAIA